MLRRPIYIDLEGADLTGKSTLLKTTFNKSDYSKMLCFHDRGILTHYIYNTFYNRFPEDHRIWYNQLINLLSKTNNYGILVLAFDDENIIRDRHKERNDDLFKLQEIIEINDYYKSFCKSTLLPLFGTDPYRVKLVVVDNKTPEKVFEEAKGFYEHMKWLGNVEERFL